MSSCAKEYIAEFNNRFTVAAAQKGHGVRAHATQGSGLDLQRAA